MDQGHETEEASAERFLAELVVHEIDNWWVREKHTGIGDCMRFSLRNLAQ